MTIRLYLDENTMPQLTLDVPPEQLQELVFQLPARDFLALADKIQDRAETLLMMRLAETGFSEWDHEEEDIYEADAQAP